MMSENAHAPISMALTEGFTPVYDELAQAHGTVHALVWGAIWRNCQKNQHVCYASHETLATSTGLSRRTIIRSIKYLLDNGLIVQHDQRGKKGQRYYGISPNVVVNWNIGANVVVTESHSSEGSGVTESHSRCDRESQQGVTESHTRKQDKKQDKKQQQPVVAVDLQKEFDRLNVHFEKDAIYANKRTGKLPLDLARTWADYGESGGPLPPAKVLICMIERGQGPPTNGTKPKEDWTYDPEFEL